MSQAVRKHVAASGEQAGHYVDCYAANCRLGARGSHVNTSVFGGAKLWLATQKRPNADAQITKENIDEFTRQPDAFAYVDQFERETSRARLNEPWSYRSNYEYNLSGLDSSAFMEACERFNRKNKTAEVTYDVILQEKHRSAQVRLPLSTAAAELNRDNLKFKHVQITGNPDPKELKRLEHILNVFITGKADQRPQPPVFKSPQG